MIRPLRTNDALAAWTNAYQVAHTDLERQGVLVHLARVKIAAGMFDEASNHLNSVTHPDYAGLKDRLEHSLLEHKYPQTNTDAVIPNETKPATVTPRNTPAPATDKIPDLQSAPPLLRQQKP